MNSAREQADAVDRQRRDLLGVLGDGQVDVEPGRRAASTGRRGRRCGGRRGRGSALASTAPSSTCPRAPSTVTSSPSRRVVVAVRVPDHARDAELAAHDRRVAGHPAAVGDQRGGAPHRRHPVGAGHRRDQDLARLQLRRAARGPCRTRTAPLARAGGRGQAHGRAPVRTRARCRLGARPARASVVIGRDWTSYSLPSASAHSMSWGAP